jgi:hypothetical protein
MLGADVNQGKGESQQATHLNLLTKLRLDVIGLSVFFFFFFFFSSQFYIISVLCSKASVAAGILALLIAKLIRCSIILKLLKVDQILAQTDMNFQVQF